MVEIVSRAAWGANPVVTPAGRIATPAPELWLHHTASRGLHGPGGMRSLQQYAMRNGYADLEYTYVVDMDGRAFMSRGPGRNSAATGGGHNPISHAICAMGNFELEYPTQTMLDTIAALTRDLHATGASGTATITGPHRAASGNSTACCGKYLIARIGDINRAAAGSTPARPPTPPTTRHPTIKRGDHGPAVSELQHKLNVGAGQGLTVDGDFGPATERAVRNLQTFLHLQVDGICGPKTWVAVDLCYQRNGGR